MKKILLIVFMMFASLVQAEEVELWRVERVIIGDWKKAFVDQYGKPLALYLISENPGLIDGSVDSSGGLINAHGSLNKRPNMWAVLSATYRATHDMTKHQYTRPHCRFLRYQPAVL